MSDLILSHLCADPAMAKVIGETIDKPDFRQGNSDVYYDLLVSIVSQQLSGKVAQVITGRLMALFPNQYPEPEAILAMEFEQLRSVGLSNSKTHYIRNVAAFFSLPEHRHKNWSELTDEEVIRFLTQIKGVGRWTAEMILMFTLHRPDVLPLDDLGIQQSMAQLFGWQESGKALHHKMIEAAEPWRPYRTYASKFLWRWPRTTTK